MNDTSCIYTFFLKTCHNVHYPPLHPLNLNRPRHLISEFQFLILGKVKPLTEAKRDHRLKKKRSITKYLLEDAKNGGDIRSQCFPVIVSRVISPNLSVFPSFLFASHLTPLLCHVTMASQVQKSKWEMCFSITFWFRLCFRGGSWIQMSAAASGESWLVRFDPQIAGKMISCQSLRQRAHHLVFVFML